MNKYCIHCYITGHVQGVWFRANTQRVARKLGLTGWVRNLSDGRVEVLACGDEDALYKLEEWLWEGPSSARVDDLVVEKKDWQDFSDFSVR